MPKKKTMIYLTERQQLQLKLHAKEKGESVAAVIRDAVDDYLMRERPAVDYMAIVGMFEGEPGDNASERVDEIVAEAIAEDVLGVPKEKQKDLPSTASQRKAGRKFSRKKKSA